MKLRAIIFLILCALIYSACSDNGTDSQNGSSNAQGLLMPLAVGNKWFYTVDITDSFYVTTTRQDSIVLIATMEKDGLIWYHDQEYNLYTMNNDTLTIWEFANTRWGFDMTDSASGDFDLVEISVPAGTFGTLHFSRPPNYPYGGLDNRYFAKGVGIVYIEDNLLYGQGSIREQHKLTSYKLVN